MQRYIRHKKIASMATLPGVDAQVIEYIASEKSKITRKPLKDFNFPQHAIVGAILHEDRAVIPRGDTRIEPGDRVVVFSLPRALDDLERFFK